MTSPTPGDDHTAAARAPTKRKTGRAKAANGIRLATDLEAMERLHELSTRLVGTVELSRMLDEILDAAIALQGADFGNVQLYDPDTRSMAIAVQRGFSQEFLDHFKVVDAADDSACGRALRLRQRVVIEDVETDPGFAAHRAIASRAGFRAVQSTPIVGRDGHPHGMMSTHFRRVHRPSAQELRLTDLYLRLAAELIARKRDEEVLREAKQAAERANETKSQFLSTMSHELRTPLTAVIGLADLLETEVVGPINPKQKAYVSRIRASAWHLVRIIDEILTFTRSEAGKEEVRLATVDLTAIAHEVIGIMAGEAKVRGLALRLSGANEPLTARTDDGKVRQIIINLIGNALKYTGTGAVEVELVAVKEWIDVRVRDTGPGIPADRVEEIFEPFVQLDGTTTRTTGGTGLGLTICRRLARLLGGDVTVESTVGEGSTFTLRLPRRPPDGDVERAASDA